MTASLRAVEVPRISHRSPSPIEDGKILATLGSKSLCSGGRGRVVEEETAERYTDAEHPIARTGVLMLGTRERR
jgi:hypothetical protein